MSNEEKSAVEQVIKAIVTDPDSVKFTFRNEDTGIETTLTFTQILEIKKATEKEKDSGITNDI